LVHKDKRRAPRTERRGVVVSAPASCPGDHRIDIWLHTPSKCMRK